MYKSEDAKEARLQRKRVQIRYPARLFIDGRCVEDALPDWFQVLGNDRLKETKWPKHNKRDIHRDRVYSENTVVDDDESEDETEESSDENSEVFDERSLEDMAIETESRNAHPDVNKRGSCDQCVNAKCVENESVKCRAKCDENVLPVKSASISDKSINRKTQDNPVSVKNPPVNNTKHSGKSNTRVTSNRSEKPGSSINNSANQTNQSKQRESRDREVKVNRSQHRDRNESRNETQNERCKNKH